VITIKKSINIIILLLAVALIISGCGSSRVKSGGKTGDDEKEKNNVTQDIKLSFDVVKNIEELPKNVQDAVEALKQQRGYAFFKVEDGFILFAGMGEKNTAGYDITVKSVENVNGTVKVTVEEKSPEKGDIVAQVISYPFTVVKVKDGMENFIVANESGEELKLLSVDKVSSVGNAEDKKEKTVVIVETQGTYVGEIDGNSVEIIVDGQPNAFRHEGRYREILDNLKENDKLSISYFENEHGQLILVTFEKLK